MREENPDCRRSYRIVLTEDGREMAEKVQKGFQEMNRLMETGFSEEELALLKSFLSRIKDNIRDKDMSEIVKST